MSSRWKSRSRIDRGGREVYGQPTPPVWDKCENIYMIFVCIFEIKFLNHSWQFSDHAIGVTAYNSVKLNLFFIFFNALSIQRTRSTNVFRMLNLCVPPMSYLPRVKTEIKHRSNFRRNRIDRLRTEYYYLKQFFLSFFSPDNPFAFYFRTPFSRFAHTVHTQSSTRLLFPFAYRPLVIVIARTSCPGGSACPSVTATLAGQIPWHVLTRGPVVRSIPHCTYV